MLSKYTLFSLKYVFSNIVLPNGYENGLGIAEYFKIFVDCCFLSVLFKNYIMSIRVHLIITIVYIS